MLRIEFAPLPEAAQQYYVNSESTLRKTPDATPHCEEREEDQNDVSKMHGPPCKGCVEREEDDSVPPHHIEHKEHENDARKLRGPQPKAV